MTDNEIHWPQGVMAALRSRGHSDEKIAAMGPRMAFLEFCEWNGLCGWGETLWEMAHEMEGWRPIKTAPCDGSRVLLFTHMPIVGSYQNFRDQGWFTDNGRPLIPTHWMPLPKAPEEE